MANNIQFLQGAPTQNIANVQSTLGALYLKNYVSGNKESNRLFIGTSNAVGGIKSIVTPTPYSLILQRDGNAMGTFDGSTDLTVNFEVVPLVASTDNAIARFDGTGGYIQNSKVLIDDDGNIVFDTGGVHAKMGVTWETISNANPYIGYATDQTDGTFALMSIAGTTYASGLAIGGSSGNLLWKGNIVPTLSAATVGSATKPVWVNNQSIVASNANVGANTANAAKPIFMNAGTLTALSVSSGTTDRPTYLNAGAITPTTYRMAATNTTATTAKAITEDLPTGIWYVNGTSDILGQTDGVCISNQYNTSYISEIYQDYRTGKLAIRGKNNGTWQSWLRILDSSISFQTNLGSTTAGTLSSLTGTSISLGITGTLPIANGGTGATTPENVLINLGITATAAELNILDGATITINGNTITGNLTGTATNATNATNAVTATNANNLYVNNTTANTNYYIIGSALQTAGNSALYRAYNTSGTANTTGVYFNGASGVLYGAAWNDYAEFRHTNEEIEAGRVVIETGKGDLILSTERLQPGAEIVSDTFGFAIGETNECKTPIAATGRVLAYPHEDRDSYKAGDAVCAGPNGTVSKMTREEIINYPDRIIGTVSEIPEYETWGYNHVKVNNRIWIRIR